MDINAVIDRAKNVVLKPKETLEAAKAGTIEFSSDIGITLFPYPKIF